MMLKAGLNKMTSKADIFIFFFENWFFILSFIVMISAFFYFFDKYNKYDDTQKEENRERKKDDFILSMDLIGLRIRSIFIILVITISVIIYYLFSS